VILTATRLIYAALIAFVLVSGLLVLWRRGADDLDAWGTFIARVIRGDRLDQPRRTADHSISGRRISSPAGPSPPEAADGTSGSSTRPNRSMYACLRSPHGGLS
jgi:hypothetical protein